MLFITSLLPFEATLLKHYVLLFWNQYVKLFVDTVLKQSVVFYLEPVYLTIFNLYPSVVFFGTNIYLILYYLSGTVLKQSIVLFLEPVC